MTSLARASTAILLATVFVCASACGESSDGDAATGGQPSTGSGPSDGNSGGASSGGTPSGGSGGAESGGQSSGGASTGGDSGAGGAAPGTGGTANPFEGYPDWVPACAVQRGIAQCPSCMEPECIVCTYGTDEEIAESEAECTESDSAYAAYCDCASCENTSGTCRFP